VTSAGSEAGGGAAVLWCDESASESSPAGADPGPSSGRKRPAAVPLTAGGTPRLDPALGLQCAVDRRCRRCRHPG